MDSCRGSLFQKRHFAADIIVTWCAGAIVFRLSLRDVEELMAERGLSVDHTTIWRWAQTYAPGSAAPLARPIKSRGCTWHIDETFVKIAAPVPCRRLRWADGGLLFIGNARPEAAKCFPSKRWRIRIIVLYRCSPATGCAAIRACNSLGFSPSRRDLPAASSRGC